MTLQCLLIKILWCLFGERQLLSLAIQTADAYFLLNCSVCHTISHFAIANYLILLKCDRKMCFLYRIFSRRVDGMSFVHDYSNLQGTLKLKMALRFGCVRAGFAVSL